MPKVCRFLCQRPVLPMSTSFGGLSCELVQVVMSDNTWNTTHKMTWSFFKEDYHRLTGCTFGFISQIQLGRQEDKLFITVFLPVEPCSNSFWLPIGAKGNIRRAPLAALHCSVVKGKAKTFFFFIGKVVIAVICSSLKAKCHLVLIKRQHPC